MANFLENMRIGLLHLFNCADPIHIGHINIPMRQISMGVLLWV